MDGQDLLHGVLEPIWRPFATALAAAYVSPHAADAVVELVSAAGLVLLAAALAHGAATVLAWSSEPPASMPSKRRAADAVCLAAALGAGPLLWWILRHPSPLVFDLFARWDHVTFAALAGCALARLPHRARIGMLALLSMAVLFPYYGALALGVVLAAHTLVFGVLHHPAARRTVPALSLHVVLVGGLYALCWWARSRNLLQAMQLYGLFSFVILRQISVAVAMRAGERPTLGGFLCYLTFYPSNAGLLGGPEVYGDFARRNLRERVALDRRTAARKVARGAVLVWLANRVPASFAAVLAATTTTAAWSASLLLFFATALRAMGLWAFIEANAILFGVLLQPNFTGLLTRTNPSELWWAWRGTFTNWLVRYVYAPLGANRRHQVVNIAACFGVSWLWHVLGLPFLTGHLTFAHLGPITFWAALNATALIGHIGWQRQGWKLLPAGTPEPVRRGTKIALTCLLACFNVAPLHFQGEHIGRFADYLRLLAGGRP